MDDIIDKLEGLTSKQKLILIIVVGILLFLMRNILLLIVALIAIAGLIWFLQTNQEAFRAAFCSFGVCI